MFMQFMVSFNIFLSVYDRKVANFVFWKMLESTSLKCPDFSVSYLDVEV